jgi:hypothetical protein
MTYTDGRERLGFVDLHGAFGVTLDGQPTDCAVLGVYDACVIRGTLYALPARMWHDGKPPALHRYEGNGIWIKVQPTIAITVNKAPLREPGIYTGGEMVLPAADPDELDEGLRLELEYERTKEAVIEMARKVLAFIRVARGMVVVDTPYGLHHDRDVEGLRAAVAAHDQAREAHLAHGDSAWASREGTDGG